MDTKMISMVSGGALLALTSTAWAGPMPVASEKAITPPMQTEQAHYYYRHHYRHHVWYHHRYHRYVWHRGWHYGWYRTRYHHYAWRHRYYRYGWNPAYPAYAAANTAGAVVNGAVGLTTLPFAWATGAWPYYGYPGYAYYGGYPYYW
jgi:hypothetical protein